MEILLRRQLSESSVMIELMVMILMDVTTSVSLQRTVVVVVLSDDHITVPNTER